jgi:RNA polymerase sigma factor (sigma-70 family)
LAAESGKAKRVKKKVKRPATPSGTTWQWKEGIMTESKSGGVHDLRTLFSLGTVAGLTDGQLLERFATRGDEAAFAALVHRHGPMVLRVCQALLSDPNDAQDASQATYLVLARRSRSVRKPDAVASWLHGVARRVAKKMRSDAARRRRAERRAAERVVEIAPDQPPSVLWEELHEEIGRLPLKYRSPIVLCGLEGRTHAEAARQLSWPEGTVKIRLARGRALLGSRLKRRGWTFSALLLALTSSPRPAEAAAIEAILRRGPDASAKGGAVSAASATALAEAVSTSLFVAKWKLAAAALVTLCGVSIVTGWTLRLADGAQPPPAAQTKSAMKKPVSPSPWPYLNDKERLKDFLYAEIGNVWPLIHDEWGVRVHDRLGVLYKDGTAKLWSGEKKQPIVSPLRHKRPIHGLTFFDEAGLLVTASDDSVKVWNAVTGELRKELESQSAGPLWLSYAPAAQRFVTIDRAQGRIIVWDATTLHSIATIGPEARLRGVAFGLSPDGRTVVTFTFSDNPAIELWDVATHKPFATLRPPSAITSEIFSADGKDLNKARLVHDKSRRDHDSPFWATVRSLGPTDPAKTN